MEKKINYLARTFDDIKSELINYSKTYYPELQEVWNDSSVGSWIIELLAAVGDDLSYHIDRAYNETNINTTSSKSALMNIARLNGLKIPGIKPSQCEVEFTCVMKTSTSDGSFDQTYCPTIKAGTQVAAGNTYWEVTRDIDFAKQFNEEGYSDRRYSPLRDSNGIITGYSVSKVAVVTGGQTNTYKKVITQDDLKPFMEIVLPDPNVTNVESILFKESANFNANIDSSLYYVDSEVITSNDDQAIKTYRFFEVNSLNDQWRFGTEVDENYVEYKALSGNTDSFGAISGDSSFVYKGQWKPVTQKFITEYTDNGFLKIIFGSGVQYDEIPSGITTDYSQYQMSKMVNNDMMGLLPKAGWTMFVLYRTGSGIASNVAVGAVNNITYKYVDFKGLNGVQNVDETAKADILRSMTVTNTSIAIGGKDFPSVDEIKYLIKYNNGGQERCVTLADYKSRMMMLPPKYGCPFRVATLEENNKIVISSLGIRNDGTLNTRLPDTLMYNMAEYMKNYKSLTHYLEFRSGKVYNVAFNISLFLDKNYNTNSVILSVINTVKDYMDVNKWQMGDDIFVGDLEKSITLLDGVIAIIDLSIDNDYNYDNKCPLPAVPGSDMNKRFTIDLSQTENVLVADYNAMYQIKSDKDIVINVKLK